VVVDAQPVERRSEREATGLGPPPLGFVGPIDADVEGDLGVSEFGADLSGSRHRGSPQPIGDRVGVGDGVDVDLVGGALAARPGVTGHPTLRIVHEPAVRRRLESGLGELVADVGEGDIGEPDDRCVPAGDEVPDRLGVVDVGTPPRVAGRQHSSHAGGHAGSDRAMLWTTPRCRSGTDPTRR
jgi:hypothetical protein